MEIERFLGFNPEFQESFYFVRCSKDTKMKAIHNYGELADAGELVSDSTLDEYYSDVEFTDEDFCITN